MFKNKLLTTVLTLAVALIFIVPAAMAAEVVQGKCVAIDEKKNTYTVEIYDTTKSKEHPYGITTNKTIVIDYTNALIGKAPEPSDIIRIAYKVEGGNNIGIRVMNITKQSIMRGH